MESFASRLAKLKNATTAFFNRLLASKQPFHSAIHGHSGPFVEVSR
jgi:hypothetical protein